MKPFKQLSALVLSLMMLLISPVSAFAYSVPNTQQITSDWTDKAAVILDGTTVGY